MRAPACAHGGASISGHLERNETANVKTENVIETRVILFASGGTRPTGARRFI